MQLMGTTIRLELLQILLKQVLQDGFSHNPLFNMENPQNITFIGFSFSEYLNKDMMMGLAILNPVYFLCMMVGASKTIPVTLSVLLGTILGPIIYLFSPEWSILLAGVIGGTIAYLVGEHSVS